MFNPQLNSRLYALLLILAISAGFASCTQKPSEEAINSFDGVIPKPASSVRGDGVFRFTGNTVITASPGLEKLSTELSRVIAGKTGIIPASGEAGQIILTLTEGGTGNKEGYKLSVTPDNISIEAAGESGIFYGIQTLRQLLAVNNGNWEVAVGRIEDQPNYEWRGAMIDVARHFFSVEDLKRYIDLCSFYKLNKVHLHLSDDQGWRIEIKSWPKLTEIGGKTQVGGGGGGFYTQEQYKDLVEYAAARYVTIVPEIDLPGHINAALASYPELYCKGVGKAPELYEGTEVGFSTLCLKKELTFKFVTDVIHELAAMTPGPYLHVGGDEAQVTPKPDYIEFINRFRKIVEAEGKIMVGWEEIAQADINEGVIAQHWHSAEYAKAAVAKGAKVLLSPSTKVYLDMKYDSTTERGYDWAALIEVDDAYNWNPDTLVAGLAREGIIGVETPIWGETLRNFKDAEFLLFPRLPGIAEVAWTSGERSFDEYRIRLGRHGKTMTELGINWYRSPKVDWVDAAQDSKIE
jgi:hexosaminidase